MSTCDLLKPIHKYMNTNTLVHTPEHEDKHTHSKAMPQKSWHLLLLKYKIYSKKILTDK